MREGIVEPVEGEDGKVRWRTTEKGRKQFAQSHSEDMEQKRLIKEFEAYIRTIAQHGVDNDAITSLFEWL